ncbi:unnamed protein product [Parnassius apollo]|uniref:(apollo) hypothetical protein n=1 Tax=Parnassius apollo TaxID=110799 RepID=A0A8S3YAB3_PARAO|nr:unnamed protein product [Parnassius apollo]
MKSLIIFALFVTTAVAVPIDSKDATVVTNELNNIGVGDYFYRYETSDGKIASEEGHLKNVGTEDEVLEVRGQYSYPGDNGVVYTITYVANEDGYKAEGAHIPRSLN